MDKPDDGVEVKTYVEKIDKLIANDLNPRTINRKAYESLKKSLKDFPEMKQLREIVVDENLTILGGHQRIHALKELGYSDVTVKQVFGLTEKQKREFIIKDNTASGEWDTDIIANQWDVEELENWGVPKFELGLIEPKLEAKEDDFDTTPPEQPQTVLGDLYEIGEHRLLCGDSMDVNQLDKLTDSNSTNIVFTDPPYGIGKSSIKNDSPELYNDVLSSIFTIPTVNGQYWLFGMFPEYIEMFGTAEANGLTPYQQLVFIKSVSRERHNKVVDKCEYLIQFASTEPYFNNVEVDFDFQHQFLSEESLVMYEQAKNDPEKWKNRFKKRDPKTIDREIRGKKSLINLFELKTNIGFANQKEGVYLSKGLGLHPTQKPPEQISKILESCTEGRWSVLDPFIGSGSTMVAAHQINRKCYGMELDPKYCDVIVTRMLKLDPSLTIKRNGEVIEWQTVAIGED